MDKMPMPYLSDPTLVPRVQQYLESNVDKTYVDINVMADDLQRSYREYNRLKRNAFRTSVKKAYSIVLQSYDVEDKDSTDDENSDDSPPEDTFVRHKLDVTNNDHAKFQHTNPLNRQIINLYSKPIPKRIDENELIDISSDDSEGAIQQPPYNNNERNTTNGPSTSQNFPVLNNIPNKKPTDQKTEKGPPIGRKRKAEGPPFPTQVKKKKSLAVLQEPSVTFQDIGGMDAVLEDVCRLLMHIRHPEVYRQIGVSPPRGFLLHGPPGCGKTLLANAIAGEIGVPLLKVAAPELVAGVSGESEERIRELFERAAYSPPCILFIDEIDAITPNRQNAQKEMERRIVAQLLSCLDDLSQNVNGDRVFVIGATNRPDAIDPALRRAGRFDREICLGIPNIQARIDILKVLTCKLKLSDNFDYETLAKLTPGYVGADLMSLTREAAMAAVNRMFGSLKSKKLKVPQIEEKSNSTPEIINNLEQSKPGEDADIVVDVETSKLPNAISETQTDNNAVVVIDDEKQTNDVIVEDVTTLNGNVVNKLDDAEIKTNDVDNQPIGLKDMITWLHDQAPLTADELVALKIEMGDFLKALKCVQPSAKREGFATVPGVTWADVGSLTLIREELQMAILGPIRHPQQFLEMGLTAQAGVLLCGPPGCGKTLLAKAIANEAGINFISVKGPELLNMYVGESERAVRVCFERARNSAPCVIFFDEIDAICPKRYDGKDSGATMRVVNQMLTEMDGVQERHGVFLLAASNRPDIIDPAVLRPGRLDKILFVGLPKATDRVDILRAITKNGTVPRLAADVDLELIGMSEQLQGYTGADLAALVKEASIIALKEYMLLYQNSERLLMVGMEHFKKAIEKIRPSVTDKDQKHYEKLRRLYTPINSDVEEMEYS